MPCVACGKKTATYLSFTGPSKTDLRICAECLESLSKKPLKKDTIHGVYKLSNRNGHAYIDVIEVEHVGQKYGGGTIIHFLPMTPNAWLKTRGYHDCPWLMAMSHFMKYNPQSVKDEELPALLGLDEQLDEAIGRRLNR